nr:RepB family plasmid replication initiator protein [Escherichia coli]WGQ30496.1 RepB family plasmid replication initiator protein [Klebsiella pneumoniae]
MNLLSVTKKTKIRHRNEINSTFSSLPLSARRILFMAMAQIDSREELSEGATFRITAREYAFIADIDVTGAYRQLKEGQKNFRPVLFAFLEINFSHLRAIKALDIRRREVNYLLMQSGL